MNLGKYIELMVDRSQKNKTEWNFSNLVLMTIANDLIVEEQDCSTVNILFVEMTITPCRCSFHFFYRYIMLNTSLRFDPDSEIIFNGRFQ